MNPIAKKLLLDWQDTLLSKIPLDNTKTASGASLCSVGVFAQVFPEHTISGLVSQGLGTLGLANQDLALVGLLVLVIGTYHKQLKEIIEKVEKKQIEETTNGTNGK